MADPDLLSPAEEVTTKKRKDTKPEKTRNRNISRRDAEARRHGELKFGS